MLRWSRFKRACQGRPRPRWLMDHNISCRVDRDINHTANFRQLPIY